MSVLVRSVRDVGTFDCGSRDLMDPAAALNLILTGVEAIDDAEPVALANASGRILATDYVSFVALPRFDNSAMDGYGVHWEDLARPMPISLPFGGSIRPGDRVAAPARPGFTVPIMTGAPVPEGIAAVIPSERVIRTADGIHLLAVPRPETNVRRRGEDVRPGTVIVPAGTVLDARHVAAIAATGGGAVSVRRRLRVAIVSTGSELVDAGTMIAAGQAVDTNRPMLMSLLASPPVELVDGGIVPDNAELLGKTLCRLSEQCDLILSSGGVSGSETDHLGRALDDAGGRHQTLKLALRPGKPILEGTLGGTRLLGLPGNPVAALVALLLFGGPLIGAMLGLSPAPNLGTLARAGGLFPHRAGRVEFVPARVVATDAQGIPIIERVGSGGSARLSPLLAADGFAELDRDAPDIPRGAEIRFHPFTTSFGLLPLGGSRSPR